MKILLTGFEAFGQSNINPSERVVGRMAEWQFEEFELETAVLPVDRFRGPEALLACVEQSQPDGVVCLGEAGGRHAISIERVAINLLDFGIADNDGLIVQDEKIVADGPDAYFTTLPVRQLKQSLNEANIPAELSLSAGAFLCNQVTYSLLHYLAQRELAVPAGFVHLPFLPQQVAAQRRPLPSMTLDLMKTAVTVILKTLCNHLA